MVQQQRITGSPIKAYHGPQAALKGCHGLHWEGWQVLHNRGNDRFCLFVRHIMTFFFVCQCVNHKIMLVSRDNIYLSSMHKEKKIKHDCPLQVIVRQTGIFASFRKLLSVSMIIILIIQTHTVIDLLIQWVYCLNKLYCSYPFKRFWAIGKPSNNHAVTVVKTDSGQHSHTCTHTDWARLWFNQLP